MIKNNSIMKCCICNNEKIGEFITINDKKYHLCCIEQLKKQKDDGIKYIRENVYIDYYGISVFREKDGVDKLLRMLGEIDG